MYSVLTFLLMMTVWVIFSGQFDAFHLTLGVMSSAFVSWLSSSLLFPEPHRSLPVIFSQLARVPGYVGWLLWEIAKANIHVLKLALHPRAGELVEPEVVRVQVPFKSDAARFVLANSITLTPGTVSIKFEGDELLVHSIDPEMAAGLESVMVPRVALLFQEKRDEQGGVS